MSEKNYDPRMHTAEHILNQAMVRMFGCDRAFSSHIERKKSKCDYRIGKELLANELLEIENAVNSVIAIGVDITEDYVTKREAVQFLDLSKLPVDAPDSIRVIRVGNYDACACIGPHVKNTNEIGKFKIISSDFNDGILRLRFKLE